MASTQHTDRPPTTVKEPGLERTGRRLGHSAGWFLAVALPLIILGVVLILVDTTWSIAFGAAALLLGSIPGIVGVALAVSSLISRWSARHKSFA